MRFTFPKIFLLLLPIRILSQQIIWEPTKSPFSGGLFQGSTFDSSGNLYLATEYGGIFCSTDKGDTWNHSHFENTYTFEMATDKRGNVFASVNGKGIICSTNGGVNWVYKNVGLPSGSIPVVYAFPKDNEILIGTYPPGLLRSFDNGNTWNKLSDLPVSIGYVGGLLVHSTGTFYLGSIDSGMFRSTDNGLTWNKIQTFPNKFKIMDILELPTGDILAATYNGIYKSADGTNWSLKLQNQFNFFNSVQYTHSGIVYASDAINGIHRSTDYGNTWEYLLFFNVAIRSMVCTSEGDVYVFAAGSGAYKQIDPNGTVWKGMNISTQEIYSLASKGDTIFSGGGNSIYVSTNHGDVWIPRKIPNLPNNTIYDLKIGRNKEVYAAVNGASVWKSSNNGMQWSRIMPYSDSTNVFFVYSLAVDSTGTVYAGFGETEYYSSTGGSIYRTAGSDTSWIKIVNGAANGTVASLFVTKNNSILASITGHGVYRSTNYGALWQKTSNGLPTGFFLGEAFGQDHLGVIYCGTADNGIFISTNDGVSWTPANTSIESERVLDILTTPDHNVFISTLSGIFKTVTTGKTWEQVSNGLSNHSVWSLVSDGSGYLYAGTIGTNVFRSSEPVISTVTNNTSGIVSEFDLSQNYPNPFNPITHIRFSIASDGMTSLTVYDIMGREVKRIVNERLTAGNYLFEWDGTNGYSQKVSSGIYFYRMQSGSFAATKKMILLK